MSNPATTIEAIAIELRDGVPVGRKLRLAVDVEELLRVGAETPQPVLYVVDDAALKRLAELDGVAFCGAKAPKKQLVSYFLAKPSAICAVDGAFRSTTRHIVSSIKAFLSAVANLSTGGKPPSRVYVLGLGSTNPGRPADLLDLLTPDDSVLGQIRAAYLGNSITCELVHKRIVQAAECEEPVLITGPSGTGKEICAYLVHKFSARGNRPCISVNCAAIPDNLVEAELFGSVEGGFTGAVDRIGKFEAADESTLFLDEVAELSPAAQAKLLRILENGEVVPVGSPTKRATVDVRLICATHRDLLGMVEAGDFRADLYYRICVLQIRTPALREHLDDVPDLARALWCRVTKDSRPFPNHLVPSLCQYPWPGNVRELRSVLTSLHVKHRHAPPTLDDFMAELDERGSLLHPPTGQPARQSIAAGSSDTAFIRQVTTHIRLIKTTFRPFSRHHRDGVDAITLAAGISTIRGLLNQFQQYLKIPADFKSPAWDALLRLETCLYEWLDAAERGPGPAREYYQEHLASNTGACNSAIRALLDTMPR